jgi:VanZ family protein
LLVINRILFALVLAVVVFAGVLPKPIPQLFSYFDLALHVGAFVVLGALGLLLPYAQKSRLHWIAGFTALLLIGIGIGIELWQGWWLPARQASLLYILADTAGVLVGAGIAFFMKQLRVLIKEANEDADKIVS